MLYLLLIVGLAQLLASSSLCDAAAHPMFISGRRAFSREGSDRAELAAIMQVYFEDVEKEGMGDRRLFFTMINDIQGNRLVRQSLCFAIINTVENLSRQVELPCLDVTDIFGLFHNIDRSTFDLLLERMAVARQEYRAPVDSMKTPMVVFTMGATGWKNFDLVVSSGNRVVSEVIEMREEDWSGPEESTGPYTLIWSRAAGSGKAIEPYSWAVDLTW